MEPLIVICDVCRRPITRIIRSPSGSIRLLGSITPEGQERGGSRSSIGPAKNGQTTKSPEWRGRVWDVSPRSDPPTGEWQGDRFKLVCLGKRHRVVRVVTLPTLTEAFLYTREANVNRLTLSQLVAAKPERI